MIHCDVCRRTVERQRAQGFVYTARQEDTGPWEVAFMRDGQSYRSWGDSLHFGIAAASLRALKAPARAIGGDRE